MTILDVFQRMFEGASLEVEDLFLLETYQIGLLPGWVPEREFAAVLWANPQLQRFLLKKQPAITAFVKEVMEKAGPAADPDELEQCGDTLVWTIADLLVYNVCPEVYDGLAFHHWDFGEIINVTPLEGKVVIDGGAGTGRVSLKAAQTAQTVFAVEPVGRLREFIREKAARQGLDNLFVVDGLLKAIPFPDNFADVLITSHALGWHLAEELPEFERVVKPGGVIIHCPGTAVNVAAEDPIHTCLISADWGYEHSQFWEADGWKWKYWKRV